MKRSCSGDGDNWSPWLETETLNGPEELSSTEEMDILCARLVGAENWSAEKARDLSALIAQVKDLGVRASLVSDGILTPYHLVHFHLYIQESRVSLQAEASAARAPPKCSFSRIKLLHHYCLLKSPHGDVGWRGFQPQPRGSGLKRITAGRKS